MTNKNKLKFLSQSVLLEETGLPKLNVTIILIVFVMLVLFIIWSVTMTMDQTTSVNGVVRQTDGENSDYVLIAMIPSTEIASIEDGYVVSISIPGITDKKPISGTIASIDKTPINDTYGNVYYEAVLSSDSGKMTDAIKAHLMPGLTANVNIVVGRQSVFSYFMNPIFKTINESM